MENSRRIEIVKDKGVNRIRIRIPEDMMPDGFHLDETPRPVSHEWFRRLVDGIKIKDARTRSERPDLLLSSWLDRDLPLRDYLLGNIACTTSRWLIFGETGVGKTLFGVEIAAAIAAGQSFLNWKGSNRPRCVMYLDGEMPAETFKERMEIIADRYGPNLLLYGYNREVLRHDEMPPLNTPAGQKWLLGEINKIKPEAIVFDSIMALLIGNMGDEEVWAPMKDLVRQLSARRIAQFWLHHTGHDASRSFGTKTREWEMDTVAAMSKTEEEGAILIEFKKARLRKPETAEQFRPQTIRMTENGWTSKGTTSAAKGKNKGEQAIIRDAFLEAYDRLADPVEPTQGLNDRPVKKVSLDAIRNELKRRGFLEIDENKAITPTARTQLNRAKMDLLSEKTLISADDLIWRWHDEKRSNDHQTDKA